MQSPDPAARMPRNRFWTWSAASIVSNPRHAPAAWREPLPQSRGPLSPGYNWGGDQDRPFKDFYLTALDEAMGTLKKSQCSPASAW